MNSANLDPTLNTAIEPKMRNEWKGRLFWASMLLAPLPLVLYPTYHSLQRMQSRPVYVFGILIWCIALFALVALVFRRWDKVTCFGHSLCSRILLAAGFIGYALGTFFASIDLTAVGWLFHVGAWLATHSGVKDSDHWNLIIHWPAFSILLKAPEFVQEKLQLSYQQLLAVVTSTCFDLFHVPFRREQFQFELARSAFSIDKMVLNSPFITWMLFVCCVWVSWQRRPVVLIPVYLGIVLLWSFAMHLTQLVVHGLVHHRYNVNLSDGWLSFLLIGSTLLAAIGLLLSSDRCIQIVFMPLPVDGGTQALNPIHRVWNRCFLPLAIDHAGDN